MSARPDGSNWGYRRSGRAVHWRGWANTKFVTGGVALIVAFSVLLAPGAKAFIFVVPAPSFPDTVTVGQTFPASLGIGNFSTPPESDANPVFTVSQIDLQPACSDGSAPLCNSGVAEAGVVALSATGTGSSTPPGNTTCEGTWTIVPDTGNPNTATRFRFEPPGGEGTLLLATGETCAVSFTALTLRVPSIDGSPDPEVQTFATSTAFRSSPLLPSPVPNSSNDRYTVLAANPLLSTEASQSGPTVPATTSDTAFLDPPSPPSSGNGAPPTGNITFDLFGPADPDCAGAPFFSNTVPVNGFGSYDTSASAAITSPGTYRWVASYSGDANYNPATTACGDPAETVTFAQATPTIVTQALTPVTIGSPISDTATVTGAGGGVADPTGTVTFTLFGPDNPTCTGEPIFTSTVPLTPAAPPTATANSGDFTPTQPGTYNWVAVYSGDDNYVGATSPCGAENESSVVNQAIAQIATTATAAVTIGSPISDSATVTAAAPPAPPPTGTVTFTLFGPDDLACAGGPIFTSADVPLPGGPPFTVDSGEFTPTAAGTYQWVAVYSGDANYPPAESPCGAPSESSVVRQAVATIATEAVTPVDFGDPISDTATVTGAAPPAPVPTGTVTFTLFGPDDPTCAGAPVFTSADVPLAGGPPPTANSGDFVPPAVGTYNWVAVYSGDAAYGSVTSPCGAPNEESVVNQVTPTITTEATATAPAGSPISDTATVTGATPPAAAPTGTVTFTVFGPDDPACDGAPVFTSVDRPLGGGPPPTATSDPFVPPGPGSYNWVAVYSGDANYASVTSPCGAPNETSVVNDSTIATQAVTPVTIGQPISDTATVSGTGVPPTGTVTFTLFGPNDPTCAGAVVFTSADRPLAGGPPPTADSGDFTPTAVGTYNWVAVYSGDANYPPATSPCGAPNEASVVNQATPTIVTSALTPVTVGSDINDTATVSGVGALAPPTGTVTFTLFGPDDPTCAGAPIFTSADRPLAGGPPPTATSGNYTTTAPGDHNWVAVYSGDATYTSVTSPCGAPNETSVVIQGEVAIATSATASAPLGGAVSDTATVTGSPSPAPAPTGTVVFTLFGPNDPTCAGAPVFTSAPVALAGGPPPTANSGNFTPTAAGSYNWVAVYSGDDSYPSATSPCGAPNETSTVNAAAITTSATTPVTIGSPISDTATVTGGAPPAAPPTGTVTFTLFGPDDPTCAGPAIFTSADRPLAGGPPPTATSEEFTPTAVGTYNWVAVYSGDANYPPATSPCGAPNEESVVDQARVTITTQAFGPVTLTQPIRDTATVTGAAGAPTPTGTVTFTLFGPNDPTCAAPAIFTSADRPLAGGPPPTATSADFTPTAVGEYNWVAVYSGDASNASVTSPCGAPDETSVVTSVPSISVDKTATPLTRPEPGGDFTFNILVTNTSTEVLTITSLTDDIYGDLTTRPGSSCNSAPGTVLQPSPGPDHTYACSFTAPFNGNAGDSQTDVVTVTATNPAGVTVTDTDDAVVSLIGDPPQIQIVKEATPLSRPEPGGAFTYNLLITNPDTLEAITITTLTDNVYGDLGNPANPNVTDNTCDDLIGDVLAPSPGPGNTTTCSFTANFTGNGGDSLTDIVTVTGVDDDGDTATDSDDATVRITDILPIIAVDKTATPASRPEPGGTFTFNVVVTNLSNESVTITSLTDDIYGNLVTRPGSGCTSAIGTVLAAAPGPGNTYSCSFTGPFNGNAGDTQTDVVTATAVDDDGNPATADDDATVAITNVLPAIQVEKSASPTSRPEPGGTFQFNIVVSNIGPEALTITSLTDDIYGNIATQGTCTTAIGTVLQPGGSYSCSFPGNFTGNAGDTQTDVVTVVGRDDDGSSVSDTDDATVTITGVPPTVNITKTPSPASLPEPGGQFTFNFVVTNTSNESVTITQLTDDIYGNLNGRGTCATGAVLAPGGQYRCSFTVTFTGPPGASQRDVVTVRVVDDDGQQAVDDDDAIITITDLLPTISVQKTANPLVRNEPGGTFTFTVVVTNTGPEAVTITDLTDDIYGNLNGRGTCAVGAVMPRNGGTYTCSFPGEFRGNAGASQTDVVTVSGVDDDGSRATARDDATVRLVDVPPTITLTKDPDPASRPDPGGSFTFHVAITNTSFEPVTLTSLTDDVYGNLNGRGNCAIGGVIQPGGVYRCSFTVDYRGPGGSSQVDRVFATVVDNDGSRGNANDDARISITPVAAPPPVVLPTIVVTTAPPLARTGSDVSGPARLALGLLVLGLLMVGASWSAGGRSRLAFGSSSPGTANIPWVGGPRSERVVAVLEPPTTGGRVADDDDDDPDDDDPSSGGPSGGLPPAGRGPSSGGGGGSAGAPSIADRAAGIGDGQGRATSASPPAAPSSASSASGPSSTNGFSPAPARVEGNPRITRLI